MKQSQLEFKAGVAGDIVTVPIHLVNCGHDDLRNILGIIVDRDLDRISI